MLVNFGSIPVGTIFIPYYRDMGEYKCSYLGKCKKISDKDAETCNDSKVKPFISAGYLIPIYHDSMVEVVSYG